MSSTVSHIHSISVDYLDPNHSETVSVLSRHDEHVTMINTIAALRYDEFNTCVTRKIWKEIVTDANRASSVHFESWSTSCQESQKRALHENRWMISHDRYSQFFRFCDIQNWTWFNCHEEWMTNSWTRQHHTSVDRIASTLLRFVTTYFLTSSSGWSRV